MSALGVCGEDVMLTSGLIARAAAMVADPLRDDIEEQPVCYLQADHDGAHHGAVLALPGPTTGSVWAVWVQGSGSELLVLPDCEGTTGSGMDACTHHGGHPGGHSFELHDPMSWSARPPVAGG